MSVTPAQIGFFDSARVTGIMQGIQDPRLGQIPLTWNARIPDVDAIDEEITAKYVNTMLVADLISEDSKAVVYTQGRFQFQSYQVPKIKFGLGMTETMISALNRIQQSNAMVADDVNYFSNMWLRRVAEAKYGVELRKEILKIAMLTDGLNYDRLGFKANGITWGMYSDLKVNDNAWSSTSTTGLSTIQSTRQIGRQRYNRVYDRVTMSTAALRALVAQTEYQTQVKTVYLSSLLGGPTPVAPLQGDSVLKRQAELILGGVGEPLTIEIDDRRYWTQDNSGKLQSNRAWPINKVVLSSSQDDGNRTSMDFASCVVAESIVGSQFPGNVVGQIPVGRGTIGYTTLADPSMNPPGLVTWAVAKGFPRKHDNAATAVIDVGTLVETFDASLPAVL